MLSHTLCAVLACFAAAAMLAAARPSGEADDGENTLVMTLRWESSRGGHGGDHPGPGPRPGPHPGPRPRPHPGPRPGPHPGPGPRPGPGPQPGPGPDPRPGCGWPAACFQYKTENGTNTTTYDQPCAFSNASDPLGALFECVEPHHRHHHRGRGGRGGHGGHGGHDHGEGCHHDTHTSFCLPKECENDTDCRGAAVCRHDWWRGHHCEVPKEYQMFTKACAVYDMHTRELVREVPCLKESDECGNFGLVFELEEKEYLTHYCEPRDEDQDKVEQEQEEKDGFGDEEYDDYEMIIDLDKQTWMVDEEGNHRVYDVEKENYLFDMQL